MKHGLIALVLALGMVASAAFAGIDEQKQAANTALSD